jgi:hypothetical protein
VETVINKTSDVGVLARIQHLPQLIDKARAVNQRLLMIERAGQSCAIGSALFERIHQPHHQEGHRAGAVRFGDSRVMALVGALCCVLPAVTGFTNKSLRGLVAGLLGPQLQHQQDELRPPPPAPARTHPASAPQQHLRAHQRGHPRRRVLHQAAEPAAQTAVGADKPPATTEVRHALKTLESAVNDYGQSARLATAA